MLLHATRILRCLCAAAIGWVVGCAANGPGSCGDGVVDGGEVCDDGRNDGRGRGCLQCHSRGSRCGDGVVAGLEACDDGNTIDGDGCDESCARPGCGDRVVQAWEQCDGASVAGRTCEALGLTGGALACVPGACVLDVGGCVGCGNGVLDDGELCERGAPQTACGGAATFTVCNATCDGVEVQACARGGPAEDCCEAGRACGDAAVQACVCERDASCCAVGWDEACVADAVVGCGAVCGAHAPVMSDAPSRVVRVSINAATWTGLVR